MTHGLADTPFSGGGSDTTAIHDDTAGEIVAITEKVLPVGADVIIIEDSADSNNKKKVQIFNLPHGFPHVGGNFVDTTDQSIAVAGTPQSITFNTNPLIDNISHTLGSDTFTINVDGVYKLMIAPQLSQGAGSAMVEFWIEKNGIDIVDSGVQKSILPNVETLPLIRWKERFVATDDIKLIWASDSVNTSLDNITSSYGGPNIPSVMFGITFVGI